MYEKADIFCVHFKLFSYCYYYYDCYFILLLSFSPQGRESYILNRKKGVKNYDKSRNDNKYLSPLKQHSVIPHFPNHCYENI